MKKTVGCIFILIFFVANQCNAQYYLGYKRTAAYNELVNYFKTQPHKTVIAGTDSTIAIQSKDSAVLPFGYTLYFNGSDICTAYRYTFNCDSCLRKSLHYNLDKEKEGWQKVNERFYVSKYKKQMALLTGLDSPVHHFTIYKMDWDRDAYDSLQKYGTDDAALWVAQQRYEPAEYRPDTAKMMVWQPGRRLVWEDFAETLQYDKYPRASAKISSGLQHGIGIRTTTNGRVTVPVHIYAVMLPKHSWVREAKIGKREVLVHEQLHFDISELAARELRRDLSTITLPANGYIKTVRALVRKKWKAFRNLQEKYDEDVYEDQHNSRLAFWLADITEKLKALEAYALPNVTVALQ